MRTPEGRKGGWVGCKSPHPAARRALRLLLETGDATDRERLMEEMARAIARAQYGSAQRQVVASMKVADIGSMTDDEIERLAVETGKAKKAAPRNARPSSKRTKTAKRDDRGPTRR